MLWSEKATTWRWGWVNKPLPAIATTIIFSLCSLLLQNWWKIRQWIIIEEIITEIGYFTLHGDLFSAEVYIQMKAETKDFFRVLFAPALGAPAKQHHSLAIHPPPPPHCTTYFHLSLLYLIVVLLQHFIHFLRRYPGFFSSSLTTERENRFIFMIIADCANDRLVGWAFECVPVFLKNIRIQDPHNHRSFRRAL